MTRIYLIALVSSIALGGGILFFEARRLSQSPRRMLLLEVMVALCAISGAMIWARLESGAAWGGLRYPGAILGLTVVLVAVRWLRLVSLPALADAVAVAMPFGFAAARVGCFLQGCCFGAHCDLPWAVSFPAGTTAWQTQRLEGVIGPAATATTLLHPLQIYFALWLLAVGFFLLWFRRRQQYRGQLALVFLAVHEPGKWALESLRYQVVPELRWASGILAVGAAVALVAIEWRRRAAPASWRHLEDVARSGDSA